MQLWQTEHIQFNRHKINNCTLQNKFFVAPSSGDLWSRLGDSEQRGSDRSAPSSSSGRKDASRRGGEKAEGEEKEEEEDDSTLQRMWGAMIKQKQERLSHKMKKSRLDNLPSLQIEISRDSSDDSDA